MHIAYVTAVSPFGKSGVGGIAAYLRAIIPPIVASGHEVTVLTSYAPMPDEHLPPGVRLVHAGPRNTHRRLATLPGMLAVSGIVREMDWSASFLHAVRTLHQRAPLDLIETPENGSFLLCLQAPVPVVVRLHGSEVTLGKYLNNREGPVVRLDRQIRAFGWRRARGVSAPSRTYAREVEERFHLPFGSVAVIPNAATLSLASEAVSSHPPEALSHPPTVLYVGRIDKLKGMSTLLKAMPLLRERVPDAQLLMAGFWQLPEPPAAWGLRQGQPSCNGVTWLGFVPPPGVATLFRQADVFVMPSLYETYGMAVAEAMAHSLPVVASRVGALPEIVRHGETGVLVRPNDSTALGEALAELLLDPEARQTLGSRGREVVSALPDTGDVAVQTLDFYRSVTAPSSDAV